MVNEKDLKTKYLRSKNREFTVHGKRDQEGHDTYLGYNYADSILL
jgi:hypothetical protein